MIAQTDRTDGITAVIFVLRNGVTSESWACLASVETTPELWASSLRDAKKRMRPLFARARSAVNAGLFLDGLLSEERRTTGWMRAEAAGDPGPWRQQALLGRDRWDADELRDLGREQAVEHLADEGAVLVIDETGFLRQGKASCGAARQYTGSIPALRGRLPTARSACSPLTCRATAMPSSIGRGICRRLGSPIRGA